MAVMKTGSFEGASIEQLRGAFEGSFEARNWPLMVQVLDELIQQGEDEGLRDLCLRAQALRNLVQDLMSSGSDVQFLESVAPVFEQTRFYLSHFHWSNCISH